MLTLLLPFVALLGRVHAAEFAEPVSLEFVSSWISHTGGYWWEDVTEYPSPELKDKLSRYGTGEEASVGIVGYLIFTEPATRTIHWAKSAADDKIIHTCTVDLRDYPKTFKASYELNTDIIADLINPGTKLHAFKIDCKVEDKEPSISQFATASSTVTASSSSEAPAPSTWPLFKEPLLITFMAKPEDLVDPKNVWWHDMTPYDTMLNGEWGTLTDDDKKKDATSDNQVQIGQMAYAGLSPVRREYVWQPKGSDGKTIILQCNLKVEFDPLVPEIWVWANSEKIEKIEPRRNGEVLSTQGAEKFDKDHPVTIDCINVEDGSTVG